MEELTEALGLGEIVLLFMSRMLLELTSYMCHVLPVAMTEVQEIKAKKKKKKSFYCLGLEWAQSRHPFPLTKASGMAESPRSRRQRLAPCLEEAVTVVWVQDS